MRVLAIETSCDETAAAVVGGVSPTLPVGVLSSVVASSEKMHIKTGGIVPEVASREQLRSIIPVVDAAMKNGTRSTRSGQALIIDNVDAVAVTVGPGLVGSLLVGVETARTLAYAWKRPIIPVNHLTAHLYANWVSENDEILRLSGSSPIRHAQGKHLARNAQDDKLALKILASSSTNHEYSLPQFPAVGLVVSGGHTDLVLMKGHQDWEFLGGTRDDAAGECLDKCARLLGLPYPGGPAIAAAAEKVAKLSSYRVTKLPRPLIYEDTYDFSFSGLKTAVARKAQELIMENGELRNKDKSELAYEIQEAVVEVLVAKLERAVKEFKPKSLLLGGGVAANQRLRQEIELRIMNYESGAKIYIPPTELCTDNAVMVGAAALLRSCELRKGKPCLSEYSWKNIQVNPGLEIA